MADAREVIELLSSSDSSSSSDSERVRRPCLPPTSSSSDEDKGEQVSRSNKSFSRSKKKFSRPVHHGHRRKRVEESENSEASEDSGEDTHRRYLSTSKRARTPKKARYSDKRPSPVRSASSRRRGDDEMRQIANKMSYSDLQAQEQAMERLMNLNRRAKASSSSTPKQKKRTSAQRSVDKETRQLRGKMSFSELQAQKQAMASFHTRKAVRPSPKPRCSESENDSESEKEDEAWEVFSRKSAKREAAVRGKERAAEDTKAVEMQPVEKQRDLRKSSPSRVENNGMKGKVAQKTARKMQVEMQSIVEGMPFSEYQAQQQALAFFRAQKRRHTPSVLSSAQKNGHSVPKSSIGGRRARMGMGGNQNATTPATSSISYVAPPSRNGFPSPATQPGSSVSNQASKRDVSSKPVVHCTAWRRLVFEDSPPNILYDVASKPYPSGSDKPLWDYDKTGQLKDKCKFVASVGKGVAITEDNFALEPPSQKDVDQQVRELVEVELPIIKRCHAHRVRHILNDARKQVSEYIGAHKLLRGELYRRLQWSDIANHQSWLEVSPIERVTTKRMLQNPGTVRPYNSLVGEVRYFVHRDPAAFETIVYPETVTHLPDDITAIRRSFSMIGVRKNTYVEDDPILRYVPYLGDGQNLTVDNDLYTETTMSEERRVAVLGDGEGLKVMNPGARDDEIMEYLLRIIVGRCGTTEEVFLALQNEAGFDRPRIDYCEMQKLYTAEQRTAKRIAGVRKMIALTQDPPTAMNEDTANLLPNTKALRELARPCWFLHSEEEPKSLAVRLQPPMSVFESNYVHAPRSMGLRDRSTYEGLVEWHRDLFCRRCFSYDCPEHGIQNPQRSHRADPVNPMVSFPGIVLENRGRANPTNGSNGNTTSEKTPNSEDVIELIGSSSSDDEPVVQKPHQHAEAPTELQPSRRSRRSQTRISSLASASLQNQEKMQEHERNIEQEKRRKQRETFARAPDNSEYLDNSYLPSVTNALKIVLSKTQACSAACCLSSKEAEPESSHGLAVLNQVDAVLVRKLASTFGPNPCVVSSILKSPSCTCRQISRFLTEQKRRRDSGDDLGNDPDSLTPRRQKYGRRQTGVGGNRSFAKRVRETRSYDRDKKFSYKPCDHDGVCDETCECTLRGHHCNKSCSCPRDCPHRFQGCNCTTGNCRTSSCPCLNAGRECDPDYCFKCGASDAAVMVFHPEFKTRSCYDMNTCCNVNMLRGNIQKKVGVAFSATHGWGAFALEPIRKGEFVLEYTGDLISDEEAERRGAIYDRKRVSYLFGVNSDYVVDAARTGNKAKFANHRAAEEANLAVKILAVNGEHRIGLYARESIEVGAELFFDYGYTHKTAPRWSQHDHPEPERRREYEIVDDENEWEQWE